MGVLVAVVLLFVLLAGPALIVACVCGTAPAPMPPDPIRPVSVVLTVLVAGVLLLPFWTLVAGETGFDPLGILDVEGEGFPPLVLYALAPFAVWLAWVVNGSSRETAHPRLAWIQGLLFVLIGPSLVLFAVTVVLYDEPHS